MVPSLSRVFSNLGPLKVKTLWVPVNLSPGVNLPRYEAEVNAWGYTSIQSPVWPLEVVLNQRHAQLCLSRFSQWCCWNWSFLGFFLRVDIPEDLILHLYLHHTRRGGCHEVGCVLVERKYETYPSLRKFREMEPGMKVLTNLGSPVALAWDDYSQLLFRGESEERTLRSEILNGGFAPGRSDGFLCTVHYKLQGCRN
jgi:hypothetical protein